MRLDPAAPIVKKERWGDYFKLSVESPDMAARAVPGQFLMVKVAPGPHPLLRRPFSIHDRDGATLDIFFKVAGEGTALLSEKRPGETIDLIGPLGRGFDLGLGLKDGAPQGRPAMAVGGGRGIAPLAFLAREIQKTGRPLKVLYGGRSLADIPLKDMLGRSGAGLSCSTDDGSFGFRGTVTGLLEKEMELAPPAALYACGPEPMLMAVDRVAAAAGVPAELSLEARMGCGFGACWGCVHRIRTEAGESWVKVCQEGPVFPGGQVVWREGT